MKKAYTKQDRIRVIEQIDKGISVKAISKSTKISEQTIRKWQQRDKQVATNRMVRPVVSHFELERLMGENTLLKEHVSALKEEKVILLRIIRGEI